MTRARLFKVVSIVTLALVSCGKGESTDQKSAGSGAGDQYIARSKATEAVELVKKMALGARAYYQEEQFGGDLSGAVAAHQFPLPSAGPVPALGACCQQGGQCQPSAAQWADPPWVALMFSVDDPHYYSYQYRVADDGKSITASAYGDLDCDGSYSTFELTVTASGDDATIGPLHQTDQLE